MKTPSEEQGPLTPGTRRTFLQKLGRIGALIGFGGLGFQSFRSLIPNVSYEAPQPI